MSKKIKVLANAVLRVYVKKKILTNYGIYAVAKTPYYDWALAHKLLNIMG